MIHNFIRSTVTSRRVPQSITFISRGLIIDKKQEQNTIFKQQQQYERESSLDRETRELMDEHISREIRETEQKIKMMERDVIYNAFLNEFKSMETKIWAKVRENRVPVKESTIEYVRQRVAERRVALEQKYKHIANLVGKDVRRSTNNTTNTTNNTTNNTSTNTRISQMLENESDEEKKKAYAHLLNFMNNDDNDNNNFTNDPMFNGLQSAFEKVAGRRMNADEMKRKVTERDLDQFFKMLDGPEGREMEEKINTVLNDKVLRSMGIEPNEYNPESLSKAAVSSSSTVNNNNNNNNTSSSSSNSSNTSTTDDNQNNNFQFSQTKIDNIKYMLQKELERNPGLGKYLQSETGSDMTTIFEDFEKALKSGELFNSLSNADRVMIANALSGEDMNKPRK